MWILWGLVGFFSSPLQCYYNAFLCNRLWMCIWDPRDCWVLLILSGHHSWLMPQLLIHKHVAALPKELRNVNSPLVQVCTSRLVHFKSAGDSFFQNENCKIKVLNAKWQHTHLVMLAFKVLLMVCHFVGDICKVIDCTHLFCITFKNIVVDFFLCNLME